MFGRALANATAATPYRVKRTFRWLKPAYISVMQLMKPVVPAEAALAACGSASAGMIVIPARQTTYAVNAAAVTAHSEIVIQQMRDNSGLPSGPTCSSANNPIQSARSPGTSLTFFLGSLASLACIKYWIVN